MPSCQFIDPLVTPFVDGELSDTERRLVDDHLRTCAPCHSRVLAERTVHQLIRARADALKPPAPEPLRARCTELAARHDARPLSPVPPPAGVGSDHAPVARPIAPRRTWATRIAPYALAASLVLVVGGAFLIQATNRSAGVLAAELTADHVKCFAMNSALGTRQLPATVESSLASGFDWRVQLPQDPARAGLELVGARPCLYAKGKVAHIMYRHEGRPVSLFMLPKMSRADRLVRVLGHEAAIWCVGDRTFVLVARESRPEVERMASFVRASMH
jgi:anti-sigma factor RsiW